MNGSAERRNTYVAHDVDDRFVKARKSGRLKRELLTNVHDTARRMDYDMTRRSNRRSLLFYVISRERNINRVNVPQIRI